MIYSSRLISFTVKWWMCTVFSILRWANEKLTLINCIKTPRHWTCILIDIYESNQEVNGRIQMAVMQSVDVFFVVKRIKLSYKLSICLWSEMLYRSYDAIALFLCLYISGTVIKFIRSCTPRNHGYQCVSVPENAKSGLAKYCTSTCDFDGCNTAQYLIPPPLHRLCLFVVIAYSVISKTSESTCLGIS